MSEQELQKLLDQITYKDGYWIERDGRDVRIGFIRRDIFTQQPGVGYSGTATIAQDDTRGDVLRTMFGLFKALEEHECREHFRVCYNGLVSQPFGPHIEYYALVEAGRHVQGQPFIPARQGPYAEDRQLADEEEREDDNSAA